MASKIAEPLEISGRVTEKISSTRKAGISGNHASPKKKRTNQEAKKYTARLKTRLRLKVTSKDLIRPRFKRTLSV